MTDPALVETLRTQGCVVLPQRVDRALVGAALAAINADLGCNGLDPAELDRFKNKTFCPGIIARPEITALFGGPVADFVRDYVGATETHGVQIALRFPGDTGVPHIDGFYDDPHEDADTPNAVLGIYLTEVGPGDGPFVTWPDHVAAVERWARGLPSIPKRNAPLSFATSISSEPKPVHGPAGTAFLCHGVLPHMNALHRGAGIRYAVFRRYYAPRYADRDVWGMLKDRSLTCACLKPR